MRLKKVIALLLILIFHNSYIYANESISIGYSAKYNNFDSFDYVNKKSKKGGNITISAFGTFDSLNPFLLKSLSPAQINNLMFDTLMTRSLDEPSSSYALIAESYTLADDELSVTFTLDKSARFSNSQPITAFDVKYSFELLTSTSAHPQYRIYWSDIKESKVINKRTITFFFKRKNPELHMMIGDLPIFSKDWLSAANFPSATKKIPIASGPYNIKDYSIGKYIIYSRKKDYWATNKPSRKYMYNFNSITIKYYKDMTVALEAFKAGEYDYILENHSKRWARDYNGPNFVNKKIIKTELIHKNNTGIQGFAFNTRKDIFSDINLRKAISLVFDFEWSNKNLFYNQYLRSNSYFSNSELSASVNVSQDELLLSRSLSINPNKIKDKVILPINNSPAEYRKSLVTAKKLLDNSGYYIKQNRLYSPRNKLITINFLLAQKGFERILAPFRNNLKRLGIILNYRTVDLSLYQQRLDNYDFDMTVVSYPQSQSPGSELLSMFSSLSYDKNGAFNFPGINDKDVDKIIDKLIYSSNRKELITAAHLLDRLLWNKYYLVPNWYINTHRVAYYDKFIQPSIKPLYYQATNYVLQTWSMK